MSSSHQPSLSDALYLGVSGSSKRFVQLPGSVCFGDVVSGGFIACLLAKHALLYASYRTAIQDQADIRSSLVSFYRPVFPHAGLVVLQLDEVSIGKAWSTLRVQLFQDSRAQPAASADFCISRLSISGITLNTGWSLLPPPPEADLEKFPTDSDPRWASYHSQFKDQGARRAFAYIKFFIPTNLPTDITYVEQWVTPGWDCYPSGSRNPLLPEARWTNDLVHFVLDCSLPIMENFHTSADGQRPLGSVEATLKWASLQKEARDVGKPDWRALELDGSLEDGYGDKVFKGSFFYGTLSTSTEIKKRLPNEGVRWLYLRTEAKSIINGRMDSQVLLFDEKMELVAISHHAVQILSGAQKTRKVSSL
ncbi:hypothetical protein K491DRAFT_769452 [Lophiostoma macrostomum CBS 122681]|uniref:Thioesterase family protein n=1 Tax=Lophiostoma macrostomum CBS 122681 TaxID=1314788 RepID=A0A6A6T4I1_9PLEO|nr:hypothetical protein K491DRAFT_769452 [Lophiostoma macrostomum CBS 122681]